MDITQLFRKTGRMGRKIGGKRSLQTMTPEDRSKRARKAAAASAEARKEGAQQRIATVGPTLQAPPVRASKPQALILADQILNRLLGYVHKGSRAHKDYYRNALPILAPRDLNWIADVLLRVEAGEHDPLRPTPY